MDEGFDCLASSLSLSSADLKRHPGAKLPTRLSRDQSRMAEATAGAATRSDCSRFGTIRFRCDDNTYGNSRARCRATYTYIYTSDHRRSARSREITNKNLSIGQEIQRLWAGNHFFSYALRLCERPNYRPPSVRRSAAAQPRAIYVADLLSTREAYAGSQEF
jgi:hypothetical protein